MKTFFNLLLHEFNKSLRNWDLSSSTIYSLINIQGINTSCLFIYFSELIRTMNQNDLMKLKYDKLEFAMNSFTSNEHKQNFFQGFQKAQKNYIALLKFAHLYKWKKSSVKVENDLCGNLLDPRSENCLELLQDNSRYYFSVSDLINICKNALLNISFSFFTEPKIPTNPYTNREFNKSHLFQIYWKIKKSNYKMPMHLQLFYDTFFDIQLLNHKHEHLLRDNYIEDFIKTAPHVTLRGRILGMIKYLKPYGELTIHDDFPSSVLVDAMKPFLRIYYISKYSLSHNDEYYGSGQILRNKFKQFCLFNPLFGRKILKRSKGFLVSTRNEKPKFRVTYQTKYIPFDKIKIESVVHDHHENENSEYIFPPSNPQQQNIIPNHNFTQPIRNVISNDDSDSDSEQDDSNDNIFDLSQERRLQESQDRLFNIIMQTNHLLQPINNDHTETQQTVMQEVDSIHNSSSSSEGELSEDDESSQATLDTNFTTTLNSFLDEINDSARNTSQQPSIINDQLYDSQEDDFEDDDDEMS